MNGRGGPGEGKRPARELEGSGRARQPADRRRAVSYSSLARLLDFLPESRLDFFSLGAWGAWGEEAEV
jgi:hypothetical protein